jgi:hypothetical protein
MMGQKLLATGANGLVGSHIEWFIENYNYARK